MSKVHDGSELFRKKKKRKWMFKEIIYLTAYEITISYCMCYFKVQMRKDIHISQFVKRFEISDICLSRNQVT